MSVGIPEDVRDRGGAVDLTGGEKVIPRACSRKHSSAYVIMIYAKCGGEIL